MGVLRPKNKEDILIENNSKTDGEELLEAVGGSAELLLAAAEILWPDVGALLVAGVAGSPAPPKQLL